MLLNINVRDKASSSVHKSRPYLPSGACIPLSLASTGQPADCSTTYVQISAVDSNEGLFLTQATCPSQIARAVLCDEFTPGLRPVAKPLSGTLPVITEVGKVNCVLASARKHPPLTSTHISVAKPGVKRVKR